MIEIMIDEEKRQQAISMINDLLKSLYSYYPIGNSEYMKKEYSGYQKLSQLTDAKIQMLIENEADSPSTIFFSHLKTALPQYELFDQSYFQFPNYVFRINISEKKTEDYRKNVFFELCISLLADYYTVFFEEQYRIDDNPPTMFAIRSYEKLVQDIKCQEIAQTIQLLMENNFPEKKYIPYKLLEEYKISGMTPFGREESHNMSKTYSLYDYLFTNVNYPDEMIAKYR